MSNTETKSLKKYYKKHTEMVSCMSLSPINTNIFASGGMDCGIALW